MARRKTNDLENQMSLMDMMASENPEYTEEGPEELLDPGEDMGDSEGQTDKPFKLVANKTTKAKVSISTQALNQLRIQLERGSPVPLRPEFCQRTMTPITGIHRQYHVAKLCELQTIKSE